MQAHNPEDPSSQFRAYAQAGGAAHSEAGGALLQNFLKLFPAGSEAGEAWQSLLSSYGANSPKLATLQSRHFQQQTALWSAMLAREFGQATGPAAGQENGDKRFAGREWRDNPYYDYVRQAYLLNSRFFDELVESASLEAPAKDRLRFFTRQLIDAMSPANFAATNPEALKIALDTKGESIHAGIQHLIQDIEKGRVSMTDESAFEVGRNLAVTPGEIVFENELIQLIQYRPAAGANKRVRARPLLMVPPCINKFYILDLQPENSLVRYAVEQGNTVFMVSWRNITEEKLSRLGWDDYIADGVLKPIEVVRAICKADKINALGFCVGGTLLSSALAVMRARGDDHVASVTLLATLLDFSQVGDIGVFVDEASVAAREAALGSGGIMSGKDLAMVFSALRANDLVWSYVVNNYLKGKSPAAFDILYWNADSTNLPGPMYCWYLRNMYLENKLREPVQLGMCGVNVDLGAIKLPTYIVATREDHIVPWKTSYLSTQLLQGETRFILGASGHVAGIINPASKNRRSFWSVGKLAASAEKLSGADKCLDADKWFEQATEIPGSWWSDWDKWLAGFSGGEVAVRKKLGSAKFKAIEPAPGRYVKQRI